MKEEGKGKGGFIEASVAVAGVEREREQSCSMASLRVFSLSIF